VTIVCFGDSLTAGFQSPTPEHPGGQETPYGRFLQIVKGPEARPLFGRHVEEFGELIVHGDEAEQEVRVYLDNGPAIVYRFVVSRQTTAECAQCWLVDGVVRVR